MESKQAPNAGQEVSPAEALGEQSKEEREKSFSRRALLQWSLPVAAAGVAAIAQADRGDSRAVTPSHGDHVDGDHTDHADSGGGK